MSRPAPIEKSLPLLPARPRDGHKGTFGTVIVVGGCATMPGAPALSAGAALRVGAGLVKIAGPAQALALSLVIEPSATGIALRGSHLREPLDQTDPLRRAVLAVGPGLGTSPAAASWVRQALMQDRPVVLDADGLNVLAQAPWAGMATKGKRSPRRWVWTPHPGEFARLAPRWQVDPAPRTVVERRTAAAALARASGAVIVLKGAGTVVSDGRRTYVNATGNPALATAGSGDVLTGAIAGLLAQGMEPWEAAVLGVYLHGKAADQWARRVGPAGMTARELARELPMVLAKHQRQR